MEQGGGCQFRYFVIHCGKNISHRRAGEGGRVAPLGYITLRCECRGVRGGLNQDEQLDGEWARELSAVELKLFFEMVSLMPGVDGDGRRGVWCARYGYE